MASITGFTAERLQQIADTTIVGGSVNQMGNLVLTTRYGASIDAGYVKGETGPIGPDRQVAAGLIQAFGGTIPPAGWMFCNGALVSRTTYSELFAAIGTSYGAGDGSTTFALPDLRGRVPVGLDTAQIEFDNLGETGGAKTHTLTTAEMPSHTHTVLGASGTDNLDFDGVSQRFAASDAVTPYDKQTAATGGGAPHNNLQPYQVVQFIISIGDAGTPAVPAEDYVGRGSTAQRDTIFGIPGTDTTRAALANRKVVWFNTDTGWEESYYATTGLTGLTVTGLVTGAAHGWYPTGRGPMLLLEPPTSVNNTGPSFVNGWGWTRRVGGGAWFTASNGTLIQILKHGRYDVRAWTVQQAGSGTTNFHLRVVAADGTTIIYNVDGNAFPLNGSLYTRVHAEVDDVILSASNQVGLYLHSGSLSIHVGSIAPRGQLLVRYIGPPLVTD